VHVLSEEFASFMLAGNKKLTGDLRAELEANRAPAAGADLEWAAERFGGAAIAGVVCASDHGLPTSERLAHALGCGGNGILAVRRDKFAMSECVRAAGLEAVRQALVLDWHMLRSSF